jgi:ribonuclease HI
MGADGHSNNTGELQAVAEALLWLKDTLAERSFSPVLFCLDSEKPSSTLRMPFKGPARCIRTASNAVLIEKGKHWQLYLEEARRRAGGFSFTHVPNQCKIPGNERADELAARGKANLRCTVGRFENCGPPRSARPETSKGPPCSEIEVIIRDFESGPGVFADADGAFAFGSRRDIELGARIRYGHCVRSGMMPHTAGPRVRLLQYTFGQPVANLREFLPDEAIPPITMGDGEAPVLAEEFKYLGSMLT